MALESKFLFEADSAGVSLGRGGGGLEAFSDFFGEVADPRAANARHDLLELMFVALAAVPCGAEDCTDMAEFAAGRRLELFSICS